jgi:hypothetical protein
MLSINKIIFSDSLMHKLNEKILAANLYVTLIKEAIYFGEFSLVAHLISIWPYQTLKLSDLISDEIINFDSLSKPLFSCGPTVLDYVLLGILITKPSSKLKLVDLTGFHKGTEFLLQQKMLNLRINLIFKRLENQSGNFAFAAVVDEAGKPTIRLHTE